MTQTRQSHPIFFLLRNRELNSLLNTCFNGAIVIRISIGLYRTTHLNRENIDQFYMNLHSLNINMPDRWVCVKHAIQNIDSYYS